jgi:hypothetical protein
MSLTWLRRRRNRLPAGPDRARIEDPGQAVVSGSMRTELERVRSPGQCLPTEFGIRSCDKYEKIPGRGLTSFQDSRILAFVFRAQHIDDRLGDRSFLCWYRNSTPPALSDFRRETGSPFSEDTLPRKNEVRFLTARMRLPGSALLVARAGRGLDRDHSLRAEASRSAVRIGKDA